MAYRTEQVYGLAAVMYRAAQVEDGTVNDMSEKVVRLEFENKHLREVLQLSHPIVSDADSNFYAENTIVAPTSKDLQDKSWS